MPYDEDTDYNRELPDGAPLRGERDELLNLDHVKGHAIGYRLKDGERTDEIVVRVYVDEKVPLEELDPDQRVPETFKGYKTDVIPRNPEPEYFGRGSRDDTSDFTTPQGASNISIVDSDASEQKGGGSGSAAFYDRNDNDAKVAITNWHVLYDSTYDAGESDVIGDWVYEPTASTNDAYVGNVRDVYWPTNSSDVDAGSYYIDDETGMSVTNHCFAFCPMHKPDGGWPDPQLGRRYMNIGARGYCEGVCVAIDETFSGTYGGVDYTHEQIAEFDNYSTNGDSGSLTGIYDPDRQEFIPVALHWGSDNTNSTPDRVSMASEINFVESKMGWDLEPIGDTTEGDYTRSTQSAHFEYCTYRSWDNNDGTYTVRGVVVNTGGDTKTAEAGLRDVETNTDGSTASENQRWSESVTLAPGEWQHLEFTIPDSYEGTWSLRHVDDGEDYYSSFDTGDDEYDMIDVTITDEGRPESDTGVGELNVGQFSLGQQSLGGREITQKNAAAVASSSVTTSAGATVAAPSGSVKNVAATGTAKGNATAIADHIEFIPDSEFWLIDGQRIDDVVTEERRWQELTLVARTSGATVKNDIRPNMENAGKYEIHETATGGHVAADDANGGNTIQLASPVARRDVRSVTKWVVDKYDEEQLDQGGDEYKVEIKAVPLESKETDGTYPSQTRATNEWAFSFANGQFTTRKASADLADRGKEGDREKELTLLLDQTQMMTLEDHASRLNAVKRREIPGEQNVAVDTSPDSRNTVTITPPDGTTDVFASGDYVVTGWSAETLGDDTYRTTVRLLPAG